MEKMRDPCGNELSFHFYSIHGGWYENGVQLQVVKLVQVQKVANAIFTLC